MELKQISRLAYLIFRHFTDSLSVEEREELERWSDADRTHRQLLEDISRKNFYTEKQVEDQVFNHVAAFQKVLDRRQQNLKRKRLWQRWTAVAAVGVVAVGISFFFLSQSLGDKVVARQEVVVELPAGSSRAVLTLADGQRMELAGRMADSVLVEDGVRLNAGGERLTYSQESPVDLSTAYHTLEIPRKGEFQLMLADGTKVWINSESLIKYPVAFKGKERRVYLEGEAYFEVSKNENMPFVVDMGKAAVQVLGTSFNARAYRDENNVYATLAEGKIRLETPGRSMYLAPDEQGIVDLTSGNISKKKVDIQLYVSWKDGRFAFQQQTLEDMMNTLSRWYDIQVFFESEALRQVTFTGNLKRYDGFNKIIELLEMTGMAHFKVEGNKVFISE